VALWLLCVAALGCWSAGAGAEGAQTSGAGEPPPPLLLSALPFSGVASSSPEQLSVDAQSRTAFEGLGREAAVALAVQDFHVDRPVWAPPGHNDGGHIASYLGEKSAVEALPSGRNVVVSSTLPLRVEGGSGQQVPVSLVLQDQGSVYAPVAPLVPVSISKEASGGISFSSGVSVAPASAGSGEAPVVVGDSVVFANTGRDTDFVAEPLPTGVEASWQLRSQSSPQDNALVFRLPPGTSLQMSTKRPGAVEVVGEGRILLMIPRASAKAADGRSLPVAYSVSGNTLITHVDLSGNVDFPVLVDPLLTGYYGELNNAEVWTGWQSYSNCGCFSLINELGELRIEVGAGQPVGDYGEWYIYAPGAGQPGGAGITRVDLRGVEHAAPNESEFQSEIGFSNGNNPVWTFNGLTGAQGPSPYSSDAELHEKAMAFCAQGAGGHDGGEQPLCDENYSGQFFLFASVIGPESLRNSNYTNMSAAAVTYLDTTPPNEVKMTVPVDWVKYGPTTMGIYGHDQGLGVQRFELQIPPGNSPYFTQSLSCNEPNGFSGCPQGESSSEINLQPLNTGVYSLGAYAVDAAGNRSQLQPAPSLYVDHTPPVMSALSGSLTRGEVGDGSYALNFEAYDGSTGEPQVGLASMEVLVDGVVHYTLHSTCHKPTGIPASNCFGFAGSWQFNGEDYGAGSHTVTVRAKDWLGNESTRSLAVTVSNAAYQPLGPGAVNLATGDYRLSATDVSMSGGAASLSFSRVYDSRYPSRGSGEQLGPGWQLSLPDQGVAAWQSLTPLPSGSVALHGTNGGELVFTSSGSSFVSPVGYETYTLTEPTTNPVTYKLVDAQGDATTFEQPASKAAFVPKTVVQASGAGGINKVTYSFTKISSEVTEPTRMLAPEPTEGSCTSSLVKGCRALTFNYASSKTASGERPTEWGNCNGQLTGVSMTAWDPAKNGGEMTTTSVAQYLYDNQCRLRAEWDPRISPELKTIYGYDSEGHVVALTPPGQETWALTYGVISGDANTGRLLAVTRPGEKAGLWNGEVPKSTVKPAISGSPIVGVKLSVNNGTWSNEPVTYRYQWQDCNSSGEGCTGILGATNPTYTPTASDVGHTLAVQVFAINGGGSVESLSTITTVVQSSGTPHEGEAPPATAPRWTVEYHVPVTGSGAPYSMSASKVAEWAQTDDPTDATAIFPPDETVGWPPAEYRRESVYYLDNLSHTVNVAQPGGGISTAEYDVHYNVKRVLTPANRLVALEAGSGSAAKSELLDTRSEYSPDGSELTGTLGPQHNVKLANGAQVLARKHTKYSYDEGAPSEGGPYRLVTKTTEGAEYEGKEADVRTTTTAYSGQSNLGWKLHEPTSTTADPNGLKSTSTTAYEASTGAVKETTSPVETASYKYAFQFGSYGGATGQFATPKGLAFESKGNFWVADDGNHRVQEFNSAGVYQHVIGSYGSEPGYFKDPKGVAVDSKGNIWVADTGNNRIQEFKENRELERYTGTLGTGAGQFNEPKGIAVDSHNNVWVADTNNNRIEEFNENGGFIEVLGWGVSNGEEKLQVCTSSCKIGKAGAGEGQFKEPHNIAFDSKGDMWVSDSANNRIEEFKENKYERKIGGEGSGNGQLKGPQGIVIDSKNDIWVADTLNNRVQEFNEKYEYVTQFGTSGTGNGQFGEPRGIGLDAQGNVWVVDTNNNRVEKWVPNTTGIHTTQTIYYTAAANSEYPACGGHPEWANLPCQGQPGAQPETSGLPSLPVTTYTYNVWDEPLVTADKSASSTRTTTVTYDAAGRTETAAITASSGTALPTVTDKYSRTLGALEEQSTTAEGKTKKITSITNTLGQMTSYTDADEKTSTFSFDVDGRPEKTSDSKGTQTFSYDSTTGFLTKLVDSAAGTFTASYNADEGVTSEGYPNGMTVKHTYDSTDRPINLEYVKSTHCTEKCTWFADSVVPSIHDQWLTQASTLSSQSYAYDNAGRLIETQDTPAEKGCTTRLYAYDEDTNRTSLRTREPGTGGACATTGGTSEYHTYDTGNRLNDAGMTYDPWGNTTKLPATDAGGSELTSTYYANNKLATQSQSGETIGYNLDPALRTREIVSTGNTTSDVINHYDGPGDSPAWTEETPSGHWTREIPSIGGGLAAIQTNNGSSETTELQLANLHGDIVATAALSETETKLLSRADTTEYGVPRSGVTYKKYSWLGTEERPNELPSGVIAMGARSYIPQLGRFLQTDPVPGGSANAYAYTGGDPVNTSDPSGAWTSTITYSLSNVSTGPGVQIPGGHDVVPGALMPPPVNLQIENAFNANPPWAAPLAFDTAPAEEEGEGGGYQPPIDLAGCFGPSHGCGHGPRQPQPNSSGSECNRTGQGCSGCRSGGSRDRNGKCKTSPSPNTGIKNACEIAGVAVGAAALSEAVPAAVVKVIAGGGASAAVACRSLG